MRRWRMLKRRIRPNRVGEGKLSPYSMHAIREDLTDVAMRLKAWENVEFGDIYVTVKDDCVVLLHGEDELGRVKIQKPHIAESDKANARAYALLKAMKELAEYGPPRT